MKPAPCHRCKGTGIERDWLKRGREMRARRESLGLSIRKTAADCEVMPSHLSNMETGSVACRGPAADRVEAYLSALERKSARADVREKE